MLQYFALAASVVSGGMAYGAGKQAREDGKLNAARETARTKMEAEFLRLQGQQQAQALMTDFTETQASNIAYLSAKTGRDISDRSIEAALAREESKVATDLGRLDTQVDFNIIQTVAQGQLNADRFRQQGRAAYKQGLAQAIGSLTSGATSYKALKG